ncbi:MAG TPA: hypothetical protein VGC14_25180 [Rhizobium sp.]
MSEIDNGGPAFPACNEANVNDTMGMTLRDWFAGQTLAGIYASQWFADHAREYHQLKTIGDAQIGAAKMAYASADAMIAARKGGA